MSEKMATNPLVGKERTVWQETVAGLFPLPNAGTDKLLRKTIVIYKRAMSEVTKEDACAYAVVKKESDVDLDIEKVDPELIYFKAESDLLLEHDELDLKEEEAKSDVGCESQQVPKEGTSATTSKRFKCNSCDFSCSKKSLLLTHIRKHTGEKPFACNTCDYKASSKGLLQRHIQGHTGEKPFACNQCSYRSVQKANLQSHMLRHTGETPFVCEACGHKFGTKANLRRHVVVRHTDCKPPFACDKCYYKCHSKTQLKRHIMKTPRCDSLIVSVVHNS